MASAPSRKNWKGMFIAIMVISAILGLIVSAVIFMTPQSDGPKVKGKSIPFGYVDDFLRCDLWRLVRPVTSGVDRTSVTVKTALRRLLLTNGICLTRNDP